MPTVERGLLLFLIGALCSFYGCMNFWAASLPVIVAGNCNRNTCHTNTLPQCRICTTFVCKYWVDDFAYVCPRRATVRMRDVHKRSFFSFALFLFPQQQRSPASASFHSIFSSITLDKQHLLSPRAHWWLAVFMSRIKMANLWQSLSYFQVCLLRHLTGEEFSQRKWSKLL